MMLRPCICLVEDEKLLKKYIEFCSKINEIIKRKKFDNDPVVKNTALPQSRRGVIPIFLKLTFLKIWAD